MTNQPPPPAPPPHPKSSAGLAWRALTDYYKAAAAFWRTTGAVLESADQNGRFDHPRMRTALEDLETALARIDTQLAVLAADPGFAYELCLACLPRDWNLDRRYDERDWLLLQIEVDRDGKPLPDDDARRWPTFRFDVGDVHWARAMVAFQRAAVDLVLAYRWEALDKLFADGDEERHPALTIKLAQAERVHRARDLILAGIEHAERCRAAYLAETDDDREWVPSPKQKNHPIPLAMDQAMYDRWGAILGDVRRLVRGEEGLSMAEMGALMDDDLSRIHGYLDVGRLLDKPADFVLDPKLLDARGDLNQIAARILRNLFGAAYVAKMKKSPLSGRLLQMQRELEQDESEVGRKLRYLLWLN